MSVGFLVGDVQASYHFQERVSSSTSKTYALSSPEDMLPNDDSTLPWARRGGRIINVEVGGVDPPPPTDGMPTSSERGKPKRFFLSTKPQAKRIRKNADKKTYELSDESVDSLLACFTRSMLD